MWEEELSVEKGYDRNSDVMMGFEVSVVFATGKNNNFTTEETKQ